jgi:hypothetical protein
VIFDRDSTPYFLEIQTPGMDGQILLTCTGNFKKCSPTKGHTLEEAMRQLANSVNTQGYIAPPEHGYGTERR